MLRRNRVHSARYQDQTLCLHRPGQTPGLPPRPSPDSHPSSTQRPMPPVRPRGWFSPWARLCENPATRCRRLVTTPPHHLAQVRPIGKSTDRKPCPGGDSAPVLATMQRRRPSVRGEPSGQRTRRTDASRRDGGGGRRTAPLRGAACQRRPKPAQAFQREHSPTFPTPSSCGEHGPYPTPCPR